MENYEGCNLAITDCLGQQVLATNVENNKTVFLPEGISSGIYFASVRDRNNELISTVKLIKH